MSSFSKNNICQGNNLNLILTVLFYAIYIFRGAKEVGFTNTNANKM
jgi:hypothetical protein